MGSILAWLCVLNVISITFGFSYYRDRIPNGHYVKISCMNRIWGPVGHKSLYPSSTNLNPFGQRFKELGYVWSRTLCEEDSDGDQVSNGRELGVENCEYPTVVNASRVVSHPGIDDKKFCTEYNQLLPSAPVGDKPATSGKTERKPQ